ncbi:MAG: ATP-binding cassette domain-containing protein [Planctomycetota bacterium]
MTGEPVIQVSDLCVAFGDNVVLENVSLDIEEGEVLTILGGSGSGKTTLMRHMIGLREPQGGSIRVLGRDIARGGADLEAARRDMGVAYQSGALFGSLSVLENVCLPLQELTDLPGSACEWIAQLKLRSVGLGQALYRLPSELSGGMKKRAAIARAMALDPKILFLDEPSAGLDPITASDLDDLILDLARSLGMTIVVVTHELASIFKIADRAVILDGARRTIVADGPPAELRDHSDDSFVRRFFRRESSNESTG